MAATTVTGQRSWRYDLAGRDRDFTLFPIPTKVVKDCGVKANTKRLVKIRLSTGRQIRGFCTITSGTETYIPTEFRDELRRAAWFDCEIIGNETAESPSLRWVPPGV
jgi:hypothetical protein